MGNKYNVGSMFAGIGGICLAFKNAGCRIAWANEYNKNACRTYRLHLEKHLKGHECNLIEDDVNNLKDPKKLGRTDIVTSGFPCQAFSVAGYRKGFEDFRGNLFFETARFIKELKPKAYLLENVKNLVGHDGGNTFEVIKKTITEELNYSFIPFILNSKDYGNIPQTRERIYIVGFKNEGKYVLNLNEDSPLEHRYKGINPKKICSLNFKIPKKIKLTKAIHDLFDKEKQEEKYYYRENHQYYLELSDAMKKSDTVYQWRRVYVRENKNNLCPTLTANMGTGGHNVPLIKDSFGIRKLTPKECLRFQGFPSNFNFPDDLVNSHCYKQAGNSVVVPVVERIAKAIVKTLDDCGK